MFDHRKRGEKPPRIVKGQLVYRAVEGDFISDNSFGVVKEVVREDGFFDLAVVEWVDGREEEVPAYELADIEEKI